MSFYDDVADYIIYWEHFAPKAYWDVNHWRVGYGSDTEGPDQGTVKQDTTTTEERAKANLELRIKQFEKICILNMGQQLWDTLTNNQKISLLDICYNYGRIPFTVTADAQATSQLFIDHSSDNGGINRIRRTAEGHHYLKPDDASQPVTVPSQAPPIPSTLTEKLADLQGKMKQLEEDSKRVEAAKEAIRQEIAAMQDQIKQAEDQIK